MNPAIKYTCNNTEIRCGESQLPLENNSSINKNKPKEHHIIYICKEWKNRLWFFQWYLQHGTQMSKGQLNRQLCSKVY